MTPCKELGYVVGDRFRVKDTYLGTQYSHGDVLILTEDDGTSIPFFQNESQGYEPACCSLFKLEKIIEWNGEGLPPVGTVCEVTHGGGYNNQWEKVKVLTGIINYDDTDTGQFPVIGLLTLSSSAHSIGSFWFLCNANDKDVKFRPIKSAREKAIDEMAKDASITKTTASINLLGSLYDAGYRKP